MADAPSATALDERYEILAEISKGGMGVVYKAHDRLQGKLVAVKILRPGQNVPGARRRFLNEAQLLARLKHPNIVVVHDFGTLNDGRNFITMEYLSGPTLGGLLKTQPQRIDPLRACRVALQLTRALIVVHELGVVHRDLKPENVFLTEIDGQTDFVKLIDFGIAKDTISKDEPAEGGSPSGQPGKPEKSGELSGLADESYSSETAKTRPGTALGSPRYMAPEQVRGGDIDARTDQYALGCILYLMLVGAVPFDGASPIDVMMAHVTKPPPPPRQRVPDLRISDGLEQLVLRMLAKEREQRFPSLREVETALLVEISVLEKKAPQKAAKSGSAAAVTPAEVARAPHKGAPTWPFFLGLLLLVAGGGYAIRQRLQSSDFTLNPSEIAAREAQKKESQLLFDSSLRWAREALGDRSAAVRQAGVAVLADCPQKEALPLLTGMLNDQDATVRIAAARALGGRPSSEPQALSALRLALRDPDARVLAAARSALLLFGDKDQRAQLRVLVAHTDSEVRRLVAEGAAADASLVDVVEKLLSDPVSAVAQGAARATLLQKPNDPRALALLAAETDLRIKLLGAARLPLAAALPLVRQGAADPDPQLRRLAAEAIIDLPAASPAGPVPRIDLLRPLTEDKDPMVAARAKSLLARLLSKPEKKQR